MRTTRRDEFCSLMNAKGNFSPVESRGTTSRRVDRETTRLLAEKRTGTTANQRKLCSVIVTALTPTTNDDSTIVPGDRT